MSNISKWLRSLFSENGTVSMVRVLSLICIVTASTLAFIGMFTTSHTLESVAILCGTFLGAGMGAKVVQKRMESKMDTIDPSTHVSKSDNLNESGQYDDKK
jgi:hypothetical protein